MLKSSCYFACLHKYGGFRRLVLDFRLICGKNAIMAALESGCRIDRILVSEGLKSCGNLLEAAKSKGVVVKFVNAAKLKKFSNCQGVVAFANNLSYFSIDEILEYDRNQNRSSFFLICNNILDPHNLGALIRTAFAAGVSGVVVSKRGCSPITEVVEKASAGAINFVKIVRVANLANAVDVLKKAGVFIYCANMGGSVFFEADLTGNIGLVVGSEGKGVSPLLLKKCDGALSIPMVGRIDSLNVSVAGGVLMFEIARQRGFV